jgi:iron complex outermembrane recepter protein
MKHLPAALGCLLLASAISTNLHAQQSKSNDPVDSSADAKATVDARAKGKAAAESATNLSAITVTTGTRTETAVDKIPGAITVVSKAEVEGTLLLTEDATAVLARNVPGYAESSQAMSCACSTAFRRARRCAKAIATAPLPTWV